MGHRLVIVGMDNPQSARPEHALWTQPPGCSGHRLWRMATARTGISEEEWLAMTDRRNLCVGGWDLQRAKAQAEEWRPELEQRTVVQLGVSVYGAMRHHSHRGMLRMPLEWQIDRDWVYIPHPSGLCRSYNDDTIVAAVEIVLADLIRMQRGETSDQAE